MAITLNGDTGIISPDFEPSGSTVPTSGMYLPTTNTLAWATNSTRNMTLDASGNLGLGTTPFGWSIKAFDLGPTGGFSSVNNQLAYTHNAYYNGTNWIYKTTRFAGQYIQASGQHQWFTAPSGTAGNAISFTQAMTLDASGNLLVGTTSTVDAGTVGIHLLGGTNGKLAIKSSSTASSYQIVFVNPNGTVGTITSSGTATAYNTSSDQRLKENIVDAPGALSSVNAIKVRSFDWKADGSHTEYGYIAQELLEVVPEAVSVPADPEEMMGVDFGKLTPRLVKAIQELTARLEALEGAK